MLFPPAMGLLRLLSQPPDSFQALSGFARNLERFTGKRRVKDDRIGLLQGKSRR
jgi:hypothetical protein